MPDGNGFTVMSLSRLERLRGMLLSAGAVLAVVAGLLVSAAGTPCVAAHSTTRALYAAYSGALYQVKRA
jgi:hypothetical protein